MSWSHGSFLAVARIGDWLARPHRGPKPEGQHRLLTPPGALRGPGLWKGSRMHLGQTGTPAPPSDRRWARNGLQNRLARFDSWYPGFAFVAQSVERLAETQEAQVRVLPKCTAGLSLSAVDGPAPPPTHVRRGNPRCDVHERCATGISSVGLEYPIWIREVRGSNPRCLTRGSCAALLFASGLSPCCALPGPGADFATSRGSGRDT